ncbi:hypothetical protein LDENG_00151150 [Lucifuga dentata]|nr:hypothetical protein LDENG_00151150 [Lucifuga dentata]
MFFSAQQLYQKIISKYWFQSGTISFNTCFVQMYFVHYLGSVNSFILFLMALDRYLAICHPLRYPLVIKNSTILILSVTAWILAKVFPLMIVIRAYPLPYCASNIIKHCYCDHIGITVLACTDRAPYGFPAFVGAMLVLLIPLAFIIFSYSSIIIAVFTIANLEGRLKTLSTCSAQLIVIALYYLPRCFVYLARDLFVLVLAVNLVIMIYSNVTKMKNFFILGFPGLSPQYYGPVSALFFFTYLVIALGNVFILVFVMYEKSLQKPTYLIFCHLALTDLTFGTVTLPKIISKYWFDDSIISFYGCFAQMFFVHYIGAVHSFMLLVMAVDRFIAVCFPLHYPALITNNTISALCGFTWFIPVFLMVGVVLHGLTLPFCKSNVIAQCYCDHISITSQGCGPDVKRVEVTTLCIAMFCLLVPLIFIVFSYVSIITVIFKISNAAGRNKTLSTCTPQIFITCLFYLPRCFVYVASTVGFSFSVDSRILVILLYSLFPAAVNPLIYCFKTQDIKQTLMKRLKKTRIGIEIKLSF